MKFLIKIFQIVPLIFVLFALELKAYALSCAYGSTGCANAATFDHLFPILITPLHIFSENALWGTLVLMFVPWRIFKSWLKFGIPWVLFSAFWVSQTFVDWPSFNPASLDPLINKNHIALYTGIIFSVVTVLIVLVQLIRKPKA